MATAIITKNSSTPAAVPVLADLLAGELAVNTADGTLFAGTGSGVIQIGDPDSALTNAANVFTETNTFADLAADAVTAVSVDTGDVTAAAVTAVSFAGDGSALTGLPASGVTAGNGVDAIEVLTTAAYTALSPKVSTTMYVLIG
jgi:hypothetical protein